MQRVKDKIWHRALRRPYALSKIVDQGEGPKTLLLIHGLGASTQIWNPLIDIMEKDRYRIISYDLLGFGDSPKPKWLNYSVNEHIKSLKKSLKNDLKANEKVIIIGHSMGSIVGTHLAAKYPKLVEDIILYQPPLLIDAKKTTNLRKKFYNILAKRPPMLIGFAKIAGRYTDKLAAINVDDDEWLPFERSLKNTILAQRTVLELTNFNKNIHIVYGRLDFVVSRVDAKRMETINPKIKLYYVNEMHDVTAKSANYLKKLLEEL